MNGKFSLTNQTFSTTSLFIALTFSIGHMDPTEKILVRLTPDTMLLLQTLVDRGEYDSLSESVADAIDKMIGSKLTPKEITKILGEHVKERPLKMESLLTDGDPESLDEALKKAVRDYVRSRIEPEE